MYKTKIFLIVIPILFALATALGVFDIDNGATGSSWSIAHRYETPAFLVILSIIGAVVAVITWIVLINYRDEMAKLRAKISTYDLVVDDYKNGLTKLKEDSQAVIKSSDGADMGTHIPTGQLLEQMGVLQVKISDAEAVISDAQVKYQEWKHSTFGNVAVYYWNAIMDNEE